VRHGFARGDALAEGRAVACHRRLGDYLEGSRVPIRSIGDAETFRFDQVPNSDVVIWNPHGSDERDRGAIFAQLKTKLVDHLLTAPGRATFIVDNAVTVTEDEVGARALGDLVRRGRHFEAEVHVLRQRVTDWFDTRIGLPSRQARTRAPDATAANCLHRRRHHRSRCMRRAERTWTTARIAARGICTGGCRTTCRPRTGTRCSLLTSSMDERQRGIYEVCGCTFAEGNTVTPRQVRIWSDGTSDTTPPRTRSG
jgi:hypothetical protein